jgi:hypothetical protein
MKELNNFIEFLISHREDERINLHKKMKYGFKHFYIEFFSDVVDRNGNPFLRPQMSIIIDNRNKCIEMNNDHEDLPIVIEDHYLVDFWTTKLDEILNSEIESKIKSLIEKTLISCDNKNLHREYLMKKIIDDESI